MGLKPDHWIRKMALEQQMIDPFFDGQKRNGVISYGLSSYGYDIRVANEFKVFTAGVGDLSVVDPKNIDIRAMVDFVGDVCIIPPNSFALARSLEYIRMPRDVLGMVIGKSTYARCGIVTNFTPLEPCFSDDTEVLTPAGWRLIKDIEIGDLVLGMAEDGFAEYQPVLAKQIYDYRGELLHFEGRSIDLLVTPEHKLLVNHRTNGYRTRKGPEKTGWHTEEAKNVWGRYGYEMTRQVRWRGETPGDYVLIQGDQYPTRAFLRFLGLWLGDGSAYIAHKDGKDSGYIIQIASFKDRDYVESVLRELGVHYFATAEGFRFFKKSLYEYLAPYVHAENKALPGEWLRLDAEHINLILEGLMRSDGNQETQTITTVSKQLADEIQMMAFMSGKAAIVRQSKPQQPRELKARVIKSNYPVYKVRLVEKHITPKVEPATHKKQFYEGKVYDVTVSNHLIFVRRNGKAIWSGNCWHGYITIEISNTTPLPAKIYANEGIAQVLFFEGDEPCEVSYADKKGKYQGQIGVVLPRL